MAYGGALTMHTLAALAFIGSLFYYADEARWVTDTIISDATATGPTDSVRLVGPMAPATKRGRPVMRLNRRSPRPGAPGSLLDPSLICRIRRSSSYTRNC